MGEKSKKKTRYPYTRRHRYLLNYRVMIPCNTQYNRTRFVSRQVLHTPREQRITRIHNCHKKLTSLYEMEHYSSEQKIDASNLELIKIVSCASEFRHGIIKSISKTFSASWKNVEPRSRIYFCCSFHIMVTP